MSVRPPLRHSPSTTRRRRVRGDRGAVSAELVVAVPALMVMVLTIVQYTVYAHAQHVAQAVAAHALADARADGASAADARASAEELATQLGPGLAHPTITVDRGPDVVTVTVTGAAPTVLPPFAFTVTATDTGPVEHLPPPGTTP